MFRTNQITSATKFIKNFKESIKYLAQDPQAILILTKSNQRFVFLNAEIYEDLMDHRLRDERFVDDLKSNFS